MFEPEPAQQRSEQACSIGSLTCKRDDIVAGFTTAKSTLARSPIRAEWVDIPIGTAKLHTRITYIRMRLTPSSNIRISAPMAKQQPMRGQEQSRS
jgi:hypothetical protein